MTSGDRYSICDFQGSVFELAGLSFFDIDPVDAPLALGRWSREIVNGHKTGYHVHLVNLYTLALARKDPELFSVLTESNAINLVDSTPLMWIARRRGLVSNRRVAVRGPGVFADALTSETSRQLRHFLLGGSEQTLAAILSRVTEGNGLIVGSYSPPFSLDCAEDACQELESHPSAPEIIWVGLGTPKQDIVGARLATRGVITVAVGAAFDFLAGTKPEAPPWVRGSGFEWLFRLATEPRRLWRRYLIDSPRTLLALRNL